MVAREGVEPPTPGFSELIFPVFPTISRLLRDCKTLETTNKADKSWVIWACSMPCYLWGKMCWAASAGTLHRRPDFQALNLEFCLVLLRRAKVKCANKHHQLTRMQQRGLIERRHAIYRRLRNRALDPNRRASNQ